MSQKVNVYDAGLTALRSEAFNRVASEFVTSVGADALVRHPGVQAAMSGTSKLGRRPDIKASSVEESRLIVFLSEQGTRVLAGMPEIIG